ncbi:hypothetical protein BDZ91DRAFT_841515 [Kalaharituber pfeilii]|nr:hypothetical protein BDZ91DRAFT_841515 [Kalaharituber pfeilii]
MPIDQVPLLLPGSAICKIRSTQYNYSPATFYVEFQSGADLERALQQSKPGVKVKPYQVRRLIGKMEGRLACGEILYEADSASLEAYRQEVQELCGRVPPDVIAQRIELLQDFLHRNGPNENVSAALNFLQSRDPRFCDLDRNQCLVMAGGNVIAAPVDYPDGISKDEYERIMQLAEGRPIWVEDPLGREVNEFTSIIYHTAAAGYKKFNDPGDHNNTYAKTLSFLFDTGATNTSGYKDDVREIFNGQLPPATGSSCAWLADGTSRHRDYWEVHVRIPTITNWRPIRFYGKDQPQPGQRTIFVLSRFQTTYQDVVNLLQRTCPVTSPLRN